jgi:NADPH:quinone reductase-like Zn-dependent oxidoreductase
MSYPKTYRAWRRSATPFPRTLKLSNETLPEALGANDVLIRIHAVSLNYRDVAMLQEGKYPAPVDDGGISASDCAAEVVAIGRSVERFALSDHVAPTIGLEILTGEERDVGDVILGSTGPGTLREYAVFHEKLLVKLPQHLTWEEVSMPKELKVCVNKGHTQGSTLTCAGITAWRVLDGLHNVPEDSTALLQVEGLAFI